MTPVSKEEKKEEKEEENEEKKQRKGLGGKAAHCEGLVFSL